MAVARERMNDNESTRLFVPAACPPMLKDTGGSIWLGKVRRSA
jgi:hypothetical protein